MSATYDTPEVLEGRPLRRAERRCRRGQADACAVLGFTFLFSERPVEGEALIHTSCIDGSPLGCHLVTAGVLEGWWAGDIEAAQAEVDEQCLFDAVADASYDPVVGGQAVAQLVMKHAAKDGWNALGHIG